MTTSVLSDILNSITPLSGFNTSVGLKVNNTMITAFFTAPNGLVSGQIISLSNTFDGLPSGEYVIPNPSYLKTLLSSSNSDISISTINGSNYFTISDTGSLIQSKINYIIESFNFTPPTSSLSTIRTLYNVADPGNYNVGLEPG